LLKDKKKHFKRSEQLWSKRKCEGLTISLLHEHRLQAEVNNAGQLFQPRVRSIDQRLKTFVTVVLQRRWDKIFYVCAIYNKVFRDE